MAFYPASHAAGDNLPERGLMAPPNSAACGSIGPDFCDLQPIFEGTVLAKMIWYL